jgi:putative DNA primase/helicase
MTTPNKNAPIASDTTEAPHSHFLINPIVPAGGECVKNLAWLKLQPRFLCWSLIPQADGAVKKTPYNPSTGGLASCNDPASWCDFETAKAAVQAGQYDSIGIALGKDLGLVIVDFDKVIEKPGDTWPDWALDIVDEIDSYTEVSASGRGLHILAWGEIPSNVNKQSCHMEIHDSGKMFAISTKFFDEDHTEIYDRSAALVALHGRIEAGKVGPNYRPLIIEKNGLSFEELERGDSPDGDASKGDYQYVAILAEKGLSDEQIDETFRSSGRMRDKWDRNAGGGKTYAERTIERVRKAQATKSTVKLPDGGFVLTGQRVVGDAFDFVLNPFDGDIDGWFPRGEISLIAASSGGGKTTVMADLLEKQFAGEMVFGHTTNRLPYLVLMEDRSKNALKRTLTRMRLDPFKFPHEIMHGEGGLAAKVQRAILAQPALPAVVFLEGIDLLGDAADGKDVAQQLKLLQQLAEHYHIAIIGSTGSPKMKAKDGYTLLRDQVIGSSVWARKAETIIVLQREHGKETDDVTVMTVLPRNAKAEVFNMVFERGRYRAMTAEEMQAGKENSASMALLNWIMERESFTRVELKRAFGSMSGTTLTQRIDGLIRSGVIKRHTKGTNVYFSVPSVEELTAQ